MAQLPCTRTPWARAPVFATLNWNARRLAVETRRLSAAPANESTDLARPGSRSTAAPAGVVWGGQVSVPDFISPGLTTTRVLTGFSVNTGPPVVLRQATATVTRVASFVAGFPKRKVKARRPTGRTLSSVVPAPGSRRRR